MRKFQIAVFAALLTSPLSTLASDTVSFGFTVEPKRLDGQMLDTGSKIITDEQWAYEVTVENRCFRDLENMEIQYIVFMKPTIPGQKMIAGHVKLRRKTGSAPVALLKNCGKFSFFTESVRLKGSRLMSGSYKNGANRWAKDDLKGLWVRLFLDGKQVAEYADPVTIIGSEPWNEPGRMKKSVK
jgi:hypothetical protein